MTSTDGESTGARLPGRYWRLWWAGAIDNVGTGALVTALPLLAVTLTTDPRLVSVVAAASYLPWLLFALPAGAVVDRYGRVGLMQTAQVFQAAVVTALAVLVAVGGMDILSLTVAAFLVGVGQVVFGIASQSVVPQIVERELLARANARQYLATTIGQSFIGPPVGSFLFGLAVALPFGLDVAALVASVLLLTTLRGGLQSRDDAAATGPAGTPRISEGLRWLAGHRLLRTLAVLLGVNTFCFQLGNVTLVLLATDELGVTAAGYGTLLAVAAVGSVLGGVLTAQLVNVFGQIPVLVVALAVNAAAFVLLGLAPDVWTLAGLLALSGLVTAIWNVVTVTLRQELVPLGLLGRVNSVYRLVGWGLIPLGALAGGVIAHEAGVRAGYPVAGVLRVLVLLISLPVLIRAHRQGQQPSST